MDLASPPQVQTPQTAYPSLPKSRWLVLLVFISFTVDLLSLVSISLFYIGLGGSLNEEVVSAIIITSLGLLAYHGPYLLGLLLSILAYSRGRKKNDYKALIFWQGVLTALTLVEGTKILLSLNPFYWQPIAWYGAGILIFGSTLAVSFYKYRSVPIRWRYVLTFLLASLLLFLGQLQNINKWRQTENDNKLLEDLTSNETLKVIGEFEALETANLRVNTFKDQGYLYLTRYKSGTYDGGLEEAKKEEEEADSLEVYRMDLESGVVSQLDLGDFAQLQVFRVGFANSNSDALMLVSTKEGSVSIVALKETGVQTIIENLNSGTELIDAGETDIWMTNVIDSSHVDWVTPSLLHFNSATESFETAYSFESDFQFDSYSDIYGTPTAAQFEDKLVLISNRDIYQIKLNSNEIDMIAQSTHSPIYSKDKIYYSEEADDHMNLYEYNPDTREKTLLLSIEGNSRCEVISNREVDYALVKEPLEDGTNAIYQVNAQSELVEINLGETDEFNFRNTWVLKKQFISLVDGIFYLYRFSGDEWEKATMDPKTSTFEVFPEKFSDEDEYGVFGIDFFENNGHLYVIRETSTVKAGKLPDKIYLLELNVDQLEFEKL
jgi:hypothetical protein